MQTWPELRAELIAQGFYEFYFAELTCKSDGDFRLSFRINSSFTPKCPKCGSVSDYAILARGFSRDEMQATLISGPLWYKPQAMRGLVAAKKPKQPLWQRKRNFWDRAERELAEGGLWQDPPPKGPGLRPTQAVVKRRIVAIAELMLRRVPQEQIARSVGLTPGHFRVTLSRRRKDIEAAMSSLQAIRN
jgi:hypothetical protein